MGEARRPSGARPAAPSLESSPWPLLAVVAVAAVVAAAIVWYDVQQERRRVTEYWDTRLTSLIAEKQQWVEAWIDERSADARVAAGYPSVIALVQQASGAQELSQPIENGGRPVPTLQAMVTAYGYVGIAVFDLQGRAIAWAGDNTVLGADVAGLARQAIAHGTLGIADLPRDGGRLWATFSMPVAGAPAGTEDRVPRPLGAVTIAADPAKSLWPLITNESAPTRTGETVVMRRDGSEAVFLSPLRHAGGRQGVRVLLQTPNLAAIYALEGQQRSGEFTDYRGVSVLAATRRIERTGWGMVRKVDRTEAFEGYRQHAQQTIAIGVLATLAFGGFVVSVTRRQRERELRATLARERALREARERYQLLIDHANDIVLFLAADGRLLEANRAAEAAYGYSRDELRGLGIVDLRAEETRESVMEQLRQAREGRVVIETVHRRRDGTTFPVEVSAVGADVGGERIIVSIIRDITERKQAEEQVRDANEALQALIGASPLAIMAIDLDGNVRLWNPAAERIFGWTQQEVLGRPLPFVPPEKQEEFRSLRERVGRGESFAGMELRRQRRDGSAIDISLSTAPLHRTSGEVSGTMAVVADITERKSAENALRESERRFREMLENVRLLAMMLDADGRITFCNDCLLEVTGWQRHELVGQDWFERLLPPEVRDSVRSEYFDDLRTNRTAPLYQNEILTRHGERRLITWSNTVWRDLDGRPLGITSIGEDITERRRAEQEIRQLNAELEERVLQRTAQLEAANRELESFNYSVSHDLRAPLRHIEGFARILAADHGPQLTEDARHCLDRICAGSERMTQLIDALLQLSRVGRAELQPRAIDLSALARSVFDDLQAGVGERAIEFVVEDLPHVSGDLVLLRQLLVNLIANALKFTRPVSPARIEVGSEARNGAGAFYVRDNGVGFDARYAGKLFHAFQRLHGQDEFEGTGIGLSIVKRIVEKHGGQVWADSTVGQGAAFYFTLGPP